MTEPFVQPPPPGERAVAVAARGLTKSFGETRAVTDLWFDARAGEVTGLLGPNGAGKTTTINMLTTLLSIDAGEASIAGIDVAKRPHAVRRVIGLAGQSAAVDDKLTARENLELFGRLYKIPKAARTQRIDHLIERFELGNFADRVAETYSGGQRRRLDVVASLVAAPPVLFLDEPTTGLDPHTRTELWSEIRELADQGTAVVLTTQYLEEADRLSDAIVIIDDGVMKASGTGAALKQDLEREVLEIHLADRRDLARAAASIAGVGAESSADPEGTRLQVPLSGGARQSLAVLRGLDADDIAIADFQLRKPTLDDVFLAMTSQGGRR
jgi:ABC-2 type transport system ATP-binding protein